MRLAARRVASEAAVVKLTTDSRRRILPVGAGDSERGEKDAGN